MSLDKLELALDHEVSVGARSRSPNLPASTMSDLTNSPEVGPVGASDLEVLLFNPAGPDGPVCARLPCPGRLAVGRDPLYGQRLAEDDVADVPVCLHFLPRKDSSASRLHFVVELRPTFCRLKNESKQGTLVNNTAIWTGCDLRHGDLIRAGQSVFRAEVHRGQQPVDLPAGPTQLYIPAGELTTSPGLLQPAAVEPLSVPAPPHLPGYRLVRRLGEGGQGTVFLAESTGGEPVALKFVRADLAADSHASIRFQRETDHLRDLRHRHIVGFRDSGKVEGLLYLVMDYIPGQSTGELVRQQGPLAFGRAVRLVCQVLEAVDHAHRAGVVHRDVKDR